MRENFLYIGILFIYLFSLLMCFAFTTRKTKKNVLTSLNDGTYATKENPTMEEYLKKSGIFSRYYMWLERMIDLTFDKERTAEDVIRYQLICFSLTIGLFCLTAFVIKIPILCILFTGMCAFLTYRPIKSLNDNYNEKLEEFDKNLPTFLNNMLMSLQSGTSLERAMELAISSIGETIYKNDLVQLLADIRTYTSSQAEPYAKLAMRVPTKDCQRFCNMVVSGLKNGNKMSDILKTESDHLNVTLINKIREAGEKHQVTATAISSGLVFLPIIILLIAPMMVNTMG